MLCLGYVAVDGVLTCVLCACAQVTKDEYDEFFKQTFSEFLEPLTYSHFNVEGTIEFSAMLFVPGMAPFQQEVLSFESWLCWGHTYVEGFTFCDAPAFLASMLLGNRATQP